MSNDKKDIINPHDRVFRQSLSNLVVAKDFFETHLSEEELSLIDLNQLQFCNTSFVDEELRETISDVVYITKLKDGSPGYISLLTEHQSTPMSIMPLRMMRYQLDIMEDHFNQCPKGNRKLPAVLCVLFYNGKRKPYPFSLNILDLFYNRELGAQTLKQFYII